MKHVISNGVTDLNAPRGWVITDRNPPPPPTIEELLTPKQLKAIKKIFPQWFKEDNNG